MEDDKVKPSLGMEIGHHCAGQSAVDLLVNDPEAINTSLAGVEITQLGGPLSQQIMGLEQVGERLGAHMLLCIGVAQSQGCLGRRGCLGIRVSNNCAPSPTALLLIWLLATSIPSIAGPPSSTVMSMKE